MRNFVNMDTCMENIISYNIFNNADVSNGDSINIIKDMLLNALDTILTKKQRKRIKMPYYMGMPMNKIAKELGVCPSTVTRNIQSAKKRLSILSYYL